MATIQTIQFGEMHINPDKVITFPQGLPGFEDVTRFTLCHEEGSDGIVHYLQSVEQGELVFSVGEPSQFGIHYQFTLSDEELSLLELTEMSDLLILILLYKDESESTGRIQPVQGAFTLPLLINESARKGIQKIMQTLTPSVLLSEISNPVE
ncbi:MAG: flagellar assembly protein FliW [Methylococcaceae bacterium]